MSGGMRVCESSGSTSDIHCGKKEEKQLVQLHLGNKVPISGQNSISDWMML